MTDQDDYVYLQDGTAFDRPTQRQRELARARKNAALIMADIRAEAQNEATRPITLEARSESGWRRWLRRFVW